MIVFSPVESMKVDRVKSRTTICSAAAWMSRVVWSGSPMTRTTWALLALSTPTVIGGTGVGMTIAAYPITTLAMRGLAAGDPGASCQQATRSGGATMGQHAPLKADEDRATSTRAESRHCGAERRVNRVNLRREFFYATPKEVRAHLVELTGELLQYDDFAEAVEFRQSQGQAEVGGASGGASGGAGDASQRG